MAYRKAALNMVRRAAIIDLALTPDDRALWLMDAPADLTGAAAKPVLPSAQRPVNFADTDLVYWDGGTPANWNNGVVNGGTGTWSATGSTFTNMNGTVNGPLQQNAGPAIFGGAAAGGVTIDNSAGQVQASGLRFDVQGYTLSGGTLLLNGAGGSVIQMNAGGTIDAVLSATGVVTKTGAGGLNIGTPLNLPNGFVIAQGAVSFDSYNRVVNTGNMSIVNNGSIYFYAVISFAGDQTHRANISGTGDIFISGKRTFTFLGDITTTGTTYIAGGTVVTSVGIGNGGTTGSIAGNIVNDYALGFSRSVDWTYGGNISGVGSVAKSGTGTMTITGNWTPGRGTSIGQGVLQIGTGGTTGTLAGAIEVGTQGIVRFNRSDTVTITGNVTGSGRLEQAGTGTLILLGSTTYGGGTTISAGTLQIGNGGTGFALGSGPIVDNGVLIFNRSDAVATASSISGTGALVKDGAGTLTLTGTGFTHAGTTTVAAGTLRIGNGTGTTFASTIVDNAALVFNQTAGVFVLSGGVSGSGTAAKTGAGSLIVTGAVTLGTTFDLTAGTLQIGAGGTSGSITSDIANSGAILFNRSDAITYAGIISGTGSVTQAGGGTLTLAGANTYSGGTVVAAGTLVLTTLGAAGTGSITFGSGAQTLAIANAALGTGGTFANPLVGLGAGDIIDLTGVVSTGAVASYDPTAGTLTLTDRTNGGTLASFNVGGGLGNNAIRVSADGTGGTAVLVAAYSSAGFMGSSENDAYTGTANGELFNLSQGGVDIVAAGAGDDGIFFGATFTAADRIDGGAGSRDQIGLQGDYSAGLVLGASTMVAVENLVLLSGSDTRFGASGEGRYSYAITVNDANVAAGQQLVVNANALLAGENLTFNGAAEQDGGFVVYGGLGTDVVTGGQQNDVFGFGEGRWNAADVVDGQGGTDQLSLQGRFSSANAVTFGAGQLVSIEQLMLMSGTTTQLGGGGLAFSYDITLNDANVLAGRSFLVNGGSLLAGETLTLNAAAESDAALTVIGGAGDDRLILGALGDTAAGGAGADRITGNGGADQLTGGAGDDVFAYLQTSDSTTAAQDHILDFATGDRIDVSAIGAFSLVSGGFTGANQLRVTSQGGGNYLVEAETSGDGQADLSILVTSDHGLTAADFIGVTGGGNAPAAPAYTLPVVSTPVDAIWFEPAAGSSLHEAAGHSGSWLGADSAPLIAEPQAI